MATFLSEIQSNWHHYFDNIEFSADDFYTSVEAAVKERKIPDVEFSRVKLSQGGLFSANREYLRIVRKAQAFDVCAAPFARGFFVSWWLGEKEGLLPFLTKSKARTYFQIDTEAMYKESVSGAIFDVIDDMTNAKSVRALSENERNTQSMASN
jgi:hypothetical protein